MAWPLASFAENNKLRVIITHIQAMICKQSKLMSKTLEYYVLCLVCVNIHPRKVSWFQKNNNLSEYCIFAVSFSQSTLGHRSVIPVVKGSSSRPLTVHPGPDPRSDAAHQYIHSRQRNLALKTTPKIWTVLKQTTGTWNYACTVCLGRIRLWLLWRVFLFDVQRFCLSLSHVLQMFILSSSWGFCQI